MESNNPNNAIANRPIYKIHGFERRIKKKEFSLLKSFVKNFWYSHQLDKDMTDFYGGHDGYPMSDDKAALMFNQAKQKMEEMKLILDEKINYEI
jgi:hypothetical protein